MIGTLLEISNKRRCIIENPPSIPANTENINIILKNLPTAKLPEESEQFSVRIYNPSLKVLKGRTYSTLESVTTITFIANSHSIIAPERI